VDVEGCPLPDDRLYDLEHDVWLAETGPGEGAVGITAALAAFAGRFTAVTFRPVEDVVERGRSVATLESVRFTGPVPLPVTGRIVARNEALLGRPKLLNDHVYDTGWIVRVALPEGATWPESLRTAEAARASYAARIAELRVHCLPGAPDVEVIEIGSECAAVLARLDEEIARRADDELVLLVTDDPTSPIELVRWSDRTGHTVVAHQRDGTLHRFLVRREANPAPRRRPPPTVSR